MMTETHVDRSLDVELSRLEGEIEYLATLEESGKDRIRAWTEESGELSDADHREIARVKADVAMWSTQRTAMQNRKVKLEIGSPADMHKDRRVLNDQMEGWIKDLDKEEPLPDFKVRVGETDIALAYSRPRISANQLVRPADGGWYTTASAELIRNLFAFGGATGLCRLVMTDTGNDWRIPNIDSKRKASHYAENAAAAVPVESTAITNIVSVRNGYRSDKFAWARTADRDSQLDLRSVLTETLARQIPAAIGQNIVKGDLATTTTQGLVEGATVVRTGTGVAAGGTSRRFGGNTAAQLQVRFDTLEEAVNQAYIEGEGGDRGFGPPAVREAYVMNRKTWNVINAGAAASDNTLTTQGRTSLSERAVRMLNSVPVVFDPEMDAPKGTNNDFDADAYIAIYGNLDYMLNRRIGDVVMHFDPYGASGDNNAISVILFADGDNRYRGALSGNPAKCEAVAVLQAGAS